MQPHKHHGVGNGKSSLPPGARAWPDKSWPDRILPPSANPSPLETKSAAAVPYLGRGGGFSEGHLCLEADIDSHLFGLLQNQKDPGVVDRMMKKLDLNSDGQLDFQEFLNLIGGIAVACHDTLLKAPHP
ncbi:hypothetical protein QYF61_023628 [Mycteria americana]|uniref:EF-hand domain-containing protein n=1 Tax=Mycteria americana TaxID=33587 RepID=A0AAN7MJH7_MYCAM|nr:hypothetical protein QYF61_023628 [Mycteria americana]